MKRLCLTAGILAISAAGAAGLPHDRFAIGTYCLNGTAQTEAHIRDLKDCGIDFVIGVSGAKAETRELMKKYGILEIVSGYIPHPPGSTKAGTFAETAPLEKFEKGGRKFADDVRSGKFPTLAALSLGDEPNAVDFPHLGKTIARTRQACGNLPLYLNLFPNYASSTKNNTNPKYPKSQLGTASYEEYVDQYCKYIPLDHICWDHYVYSYSRKTGIPRFYDNFRIVADACRRTGRTLRFVPQVNSAKPEMWLSANMLRFQGFVTMAFGGESVAWACWTKGWWHNLVLDSKGEKTEQYEKLKKVNGELKTVGAAYMRFRNVATHFVGFAADDPDLKGLPVVSPAELDAGYVTGLAAADGRPLLVGEMAPRASGTDAKAFLVVAAEDPFDTAPAVRAVRFRLADGLRATVIGGEGKVALTPDAEGRLSFPLASSAGALLVVAGAAD